MFAASTLALPVGIGTVRVSVTAIITVVAASLLRVLLARVVRVWRLLV